MPLPADHWTPVSKEGGGEAGSGARAGAYGGSSGEGVGGGGGKKVAVVSYLDSTDAAQVTLDLGSRARVGCGGTERVEATSQNMVRVGGANLRGQQRDREE